jgi:hypothetical protein
MPPKTKSGFYPKSLSTRYINAEVLQFLALKDPFLPSLLQDDAVCLVLNAKVPVSTHLSVA